MLLCDVSALQWLLCGYDNDYDNNGNLGSKEGRMGQNVSFVISSIHIFLLTSTSLCIGTTILRGATLFFSRVIFATDIERFWNSLSSTMVHSVALVKT